MGHRVVYIVDAFTDVPFKGNPAAVFLLDKPADEAWMQKVAAELNLSETAFMVREREGEYRLRWFTPFAEVDLCGHATLASAHVLWELDELTRDRQAIFHTNSGILTASAKGEWIEMNFPAEPAAEAPSYVAPLEKALSVTPVFVGMNRMDLLVEVRSEAELLALKPDFELLKALPVRGVIVTTGQSAQGYDFVSRCFYPAVGVTEDPVTGSAHCCLAPYWGSRRHQVSFRAFQASSRGGEVRLRLDGNRVWIAGQAVTVMKSEWLG